MEIHILHDLQVLQGQRTIGRRFLGSAAEIVQGDRVAILGLLEDIRRCYDHVPAHQANEGPYLGLSSQPSTSSRVVPDEPPIRRSNLFVAESPVAQGLVLDEISSRSCPQSRECPQPAAPVLHKPASVELVVEGINLRRLAAWLTQLGVPVSCQSLNKELLDEFGDGTVLCRIAACLDGGRDLPGVTLKFKGNKRKASCLYNLRKALEALERKKKIPIEYLHCENEVYNGKSEAILPLLEHIRVASWATKQNLRQKPEGQIPRQPLAEHVNCK